MPDPGEWLHNRQEFTSMMQQQLLRAQQWMKVQTDKHRSERDFQVGDLVYLKVQPYV
jgi:exosome complex RNA-binding protein Rrp4